MKTLREMHGKTSKASLSIEAPFYCEYHHRRTRSDPGSSWGERERRTSTLEHSLEISRSLGRQREGCFRIRLAHVVPKFSKPYFQRAEKGEGRGLRCDRLG